MNKSTIKMPVKINAKERQQYMRDMGISMFEKRRYDEEIKVYNASTREFEIYNTKQEKVEGAKKR